jgi:ribosomal protein S8
MNPSQMVMTAQGIMHRDVAARLGLPGTPISGAPESSGGVSTTTTSRTTASTSAVVARSAGYGIMNPALMVMTSQGIMHRDAAARLGLPGTPISGAPESSGGVITTTTIRR